MIIRTYTAESVAAALKRVRSEMGGQAVVLKTRMSDGPLGKKQYEVTACLDKASVEQASKALAEEPVTKPVAAPAPAAPARMKPTVKSPAPAAVPAETFDRRLSAIEAKLDQLLRARTSGPPRVIESELHREVVSRLRAVDSPDALVQSLTVKLSTSGQDDELEAASSLLAEKLNGLIAPELTFKGGDRVLVLGPAGAGKTSVLGNLAAQLVAEQKMSVRLTSLDCSKVGAIDEMESYGALLGLSVDHVAESAASGDEKQVLLIDSGPLPTDSAAIDQLRARVEKIAPTACLAVISAMTRATEFERFAARAASLGASHLVVTMTDLSQGWGAIVAGAENSGLKLAFVSSAPGGAGRLLRPDAAAIADTVFGSEAVRE